MTTKLAFLATAGKASQDDSTATVLFMVGGFVLIVFVTAWITNFIIDCKKRDRNK